MPRVAPLAGRELHAIVAMRSQCKVRDAQCMGRILVLSRRCDKGLLYLTMRTASDLRYVTAPRCPKLSATDERSHACERCHARRVVGIRPKSFCRASDPPGWAPLPRDQRKRACEDCICAIIGISMRGCGAFGSCSPIFWSSHCRCRPLPRAARDAAVCLAASRQRQTRATVIPRRLTRTRCTDSRRDRMRSRPPTICSATAVAPCAE